MSLGEWEPMLMGPYILSMPSWLVFIDTPIANTGMVL